MKKLITIIAVLLLPQITFAETAVEPVILTELGAKNLGIETVVVEETDFEKTVFALGRTQIIPENRIPGRIIETHLKIGDYVEKGQKLILLESRQPGSPPPSLWLTAPASGTITSVNSSLGSPVEPSEALAEITDLSTLYLIATVPQVTSGKINKATTANIHFPISPESKHTAKFLKFDAYGIGTSSSDSEDHDADLNNARVIFTLENPDKILLPNMNAECSIIMEKREGVTSVPREAIQGTPSNRHVYIKHMTIPFAFDKVNVQTGMTSNDHVEILDGLILGDEVVTRGSYSLGFAGGGSGVSLKEAMDVAHGHEHNEDGSELTPEQKAAAAKGGKDDAHGHNEEGISMREMLLMISTGILAIVLVVVLLRRPYANETTELS
jgi:membrane fusion protein, heavy metal efflux system